MRCPSCRGTIRQGRDPDGRRVLYCPKCGLGKDRLAPGAEEDSSVAPAISLRLVACWVATLGFAVGPYLILEQLLPVSGSKLLAGYVWGLLIYVGLAYLVEPRWDPDNLGWWGGRIDNPFTWEDDWNRTMRNLAVALWPGKLMWRTVAHTISLLGKASDDSDRG